MERFMLVPKNLIFIEIGEAFAKLWTIQNY